MVVSVLGWLLGWLLVCLDGCLGECWCVGALGNTNNEWKKSDFS
jgi:hypothetical protein